MNTISSNLNLSKRVWGTYLNIPRNHFFFLFTIIFRCVLMHVDQYEFTIPYRLSSTISGSYVHFNNAVDDDLFNKLKRNGHTLRTVHIVYYTYKVHYSVNNNNNIILIILETIKCKQKILPWYYL